MMRVFLLVCMSAMTAAVVAPANAEDIGPAASGDVATPSPETPVTVARADPVEAIVVTARRRKEDPQHIPVAVTALSGDDLNARGVKSSLDLQNIAPSLNISGNLGQRDADVFTIRGQGQPFGGADPGVETYFAEVPFNAGGPGVYFDLENVQVLNGPQGTLVRPQHDRRRGPVRAEEAHERDRRLYDRDRRQLRPAVAARRAQRADREG